MIAEAGNSGSQPRGDGMSLRYVVGIDGSEHSRRGLEWTVGQAAVHGATVEAVLAWQYPFEERPFSPSRDDLMGLEADWTDTLDRVVGEVGVGQLGEPIACAILSAPHAGAALVEHAKDADLLVVGTRGRGGFLGLLFGSVADYCLHQATCPTAFVPPNPLPTRGGTIVGLDGSAASTAALRWAVERSTRDGGRVTALHAWNWIDKPKEATWDTFFDADDAEAFVEEVIASSGVDRTMMDVVVVNDLPSHALVEAASDAALLVVGSHGQNAAKMLLSGSVARQASHHSPAPVVIHR